MTPPSQLGCSLQTLGLNLPETNILWIDETKFLSHLSNFQSEFLPEIIAPILIDFLWSQLRNSIRHKTQ